MLPTYIVLTLLIQGTYAAAPSAPWQRHTIDSSSRGADGVRVADVNGDRLLDITTGWEEGGVIRVYLNPGPQAAKIKWPAVTVGHVASPEDAVFVDLDRDGAVDVVSCCEGRNRTMYVHWAPPLPDRLLDPEAWSTAAIPITRQQQMWMFCLPMQIDGQHGVDLVVGSKGKDAAIGWLEAPENPRNLARWQYHRLYDAGWIMSLISRDLDDDGDQEIVASDRKGPRSGVLWLENPGSAAAAAGENWTEHRIGALGKEAMFLKLGDLDQDGMDDIIATTWHGHLEFFRRLPAEGVSWQSNQIDLPFGLQRGKSLAVADLDLDGSQDLVTTNRSVPPDGPAVALMEFDQSPTDRRWKSHDIGGPEGSKFDLIELIDLDADGDLDVVTCEEVANLGVVWYENPTR